MPPSRVSNHPPTYHPYSSNMCPASQVPTPQLSSPPGATSTGRWNSSPSSDDEPPELMRQRLGPTSRVSLWARTSPNASPSYGGLPRNLDSGRVSPASPHRALGWSHSTNSEMSTT